MLCHLALWHCWRAQIERPAPAVVPHLCFTQATNVDPYLLLPSFTVPVNQNFVLMSFEQIFKRNIFHKLTMLTWSVNIPAVNSERRNTTYFRMYAATHFMILAEIGILVDLSIYQVHFVPISFVNKWRILWWKGSLLYSWSFRQPLICIIFYCLVLINDTTVSFQFSFPCHFQLTLCYLLISFS